MPTLQFALKGQYITRIDSLPPVAKSRNYFYAHFDFQTPEWTGIKTALFTQGKQTKAAVLDDNNECLLPWEVDIKIFKSGYQESDASAPPTPGVYEQILQ